MALIINEFLCAKLALTCTPLYPALLRPKFFLFWVCVVGGGWLRGVNHPCAGFVRFYTQRGSEVSYKGGRRVWELCTKWIIRPYYITRAAIMDTGLQRKSGMRQCLNLFSLLIIPPSQLKKNKIKKGHKRYSNTGKNKMIWSIYNLIKYGEIKIRNVLRYYIN